jgi:hypothetical protein
LQQINFVNWRIGEIVFTCHEQVINWMSLDFLVSRLKTFKNLKYFFTRAEATMPTQILISSASSLFEILEFEFESTDEENLFQFHDFFQIYTSAISRKNYIKKASTPARPRSDKKCWCAFAEFLQNIYRNNLLEKYRNLSSFNFFF